MMDGDLEASKLDAVQPYGTQIPHHELDMGFHAFVRTLEPEICQTIEKTPQRQGRICREQILLN